MDSRTRMQLRALNRRFYEKHALGFDASRDHAWPGWERLELRMPRDASAPMRVLDVGCGNARFARTLHERLGDRFRYTGVDENAALLERARDALADMTSVDAQLIRADVLDRVAGDTLPHGPFDLVVAFGLLHHVPGFEDRRSLLRALAGRLGDRGMLVVTAWQFADRTRFEKHLVPWSEQATAVDPPIDTAQLEEGDHLLSFDGDRTALRYCHHCSERELDRLAAALPLTPRPRFSADGRSGDLNRYLIFDRAPSPESRNVA